MKRTATFLLFVVVGVVFGCDSGQYTCDNGNCVSSFYRCDGDNDCNDQSDEIGCPPCSRSQFTCHDGTCKPASFACDSWVDCSDGEDDSGCGNCGLGEFMCSNGDCIDEDDVCNNNDDCGDGSDERGCGNLSKRAFLGAVSGNKKSKNQIQRKGVKGSSDKLARKIHAALKKSKGKFAVAKENHKDVDIESNVDK